MSGGISEFRQLEGDLYGTTESDSDDGSTGFGDGSNRWIPGITETLANPIDRISNPYDTVAGAADAATLNFDEGVGGLTSLFDSEGGNTAGPGQEPMFTFGASQADGETGDGLGQGGGAQLLGAVPRNVKLLLFVVLLGIVVQVFAPLLALLDDN